MQRRQLCSRISSSSNTALCPSPHLPPMPTWEGIEDVGSTPTRVWLSRKSVDDLWKPLRKADCRALNNNNNDIVYIDGGRATADPNKGLIHENFCQKAPPTLLTSATWFTKEEVSKQIILKPVPELDSGIVEDLYQRAVTATSTLGSGMDGVLQETYVLPGDSEYNVMVVKVGNTLQMKKRSKGWFGKEWDLQRGWGEYVVQGEQEEESLGPVQHLIFCVHGIGEAMWSRDVKAYSLAEEVNRARRNLQKMQVAEWKKQCEQARKEGEPDPSPPNRIELLPIEWYSLIHSSSNSLMTSLKATTLQSIPSLRAIANDVIFDVLMYMTATFCQSVLECVTEQITEVYQKFKKVHPQYGGKASLIGHSLGSVIVWDLLSILKQHNEQQHNDAVMKQEPTATTGAIPDTANVLCGIDIANNPNSANLRNTHLHGYQAYATTDEHANKAENGYWGPSLPKLMKQSIPFIPEFTIFLGSPLGLFLTLRGAHAVFDEMRIQQQTNNTAKEEEESLKQEQQQSERQTSTDSYEIVDKDQVQSESEGDGVSPFTLPSGAIYNIFHPSDPVAYRVEPLLLPQDTSVVNLPPPLYLTKQGQSVRFHVKAMQLTRSIAEKSNTWSSLLNQVTEQAVTALSTNSSNAEDESTKQTKKKKVPAKQPITKFPLGGKSDRVDFQLQPGVIDNEYLSAVTAHSNYFVNTDLLEFVLDLVSVQQQQEHNDKDKKTKTVETEREETTVTEEQKAEP